MKKYVVDASLVVNALIEENKKLRMRCRQILDKAENKQLRLIAPDSLKQEVANALLFKYKKAEQILPILQDFFSVDIRYIRLDDPLMVQSLRLAADVNGTVYDATYHAVALRRGAIFLTCDRKYFERAKEWGGIELVG